MPAQPALFTKPALVGPFAYLSTAVGSNFPPLYQVHRLLPSPWGPVIFCAFPGTKLQNQLPEFPRNNSARHPFRTWLIMTLCSPNGRGVGRTERSMRTSRTPRTMLLVACHHHDIARYDSLKVFEPSISHSHGPAGTKQRCPMLAIAHGQRTHNSWLSRHIHAMRGSVARTMEHTDMPETRGLHPAHRYVQG